MTDIAKLPDEWLGKAEATSGDAFHAGWVVGMKEAAEDLTNALPKWTRITDNPDTWPPSDRQYALSLDHETALSTGWWNAKNFIGYYWRPLCGLDFPPDSTECE